MSTEILNNIKSTYTAYDMSPIDIMKDNDKLLRYACESNNIELFDWILTKCNYDKYDITVTRIRNILEFMKNQTNDSCLKIICKKGNLDILQKCMSLYDIENDIYENFNIICAYGHIHMVNYLLSRNININKYRYQIIEGFIESCIHNNLELAKLIFEQINLTHVEIMATGYYKSKKHNHQDILICLHSILFKKKYQNEYN